MNKQCKNCEHSLCFKGQGGGKAYFCLLKKLPKKERVGFDKYKRVKPNDVCEKYGSR